MESSHIAMLSSHVVLGHVLSVPVRIAVVVRRYRCVTCLVRDPQGMLSF